jgi:hypothetical protein
MECVMRVSNITAAALMVALIAPSSARAELLRAQLNVLGMD